MGDMAWDLSKCPWCLSHWFAGAFALYSPLELTSVWVLNWVLTAFFIVALAPAAAFMVHRVYGPLPPVPTEADWHSDEFEAVGGQAGGDKP
jgi:hypothetical protein